MSDKPFIKVIMPGSYDWNEPMTSLVDVHSRGIDKSWMVKRAAAGVFRNLDIKPRAGHSIIHLIALGDSDFYGCNRNGDAFFKSGKVIELPEPKVGVDKHLKIACGNVDRHDTFEKFAKVYRHHINKDPMRAHGDVMKSAHNDAVNRVELLIDVEDKGWSDDLEKLAKGEDIDFSMACRVPYDYCSICGNKAANRSQYCKDLLDHMTEFTKSGHQVAALNDYMTYFDISRVTSRADRIALGLLKAASDKVVSGSELADGCTFFPPGDFGRIVAFPAEMLSKLSAMEKEIAAAGHLEDGDAKTLAKAFDRDASPDPDSKDTERLSCMRSHMDSILGGMADAKISLPLKDFFKLLMGPKFGDVESAVPEAEELLPGIFTRMLGKGEPFAPFDLGKEALPAHVREIIQKMIPAHSMDDGPVQHRIMVTIVRGKAPPALRGEKAEAMDKQGGVSKASQLADTYARYKLAVCERAGGVTNKSLTERLVLQHYVLR